MFHTHDVIVLREQVGGVDPMNNPITTTTQQTVSGVLIAPSAAVAISAADEDYGSADRPYGVKTSYVLYFPKTFNQPLRGALIVVPDEEEPLKVVGDPKPYDPRNTPGEFNYVVYLEKVKG